jgi:hypothetical protein
MIGYVYLYGLSLVSHSIVTRVLRLQLLLYAASASLPWSLFVYAAFDSFPLSLTRHAAFGSFLLCHYCYMQLLLLSSLRPFLLLFRYAAFVALSWSLYKVMALETISDNDITSSGVIATGIIFRSTTATALVVWSGKTSPLKPKIWMQEIMMI